MHNILDKTKGRVDSAEVFFVKSHKTEIAYEGWKLKKSSVVQKEGYSLRVTKNGKVGFSATTDPAGIDEMIENAIATVKFGEQVNLVFPGPTALPDLDLFDEKLEALTIPDIIGFGGKFIDKCEKFRDIADLNFEATRAIVEVKLANTSGFDSGYRKIYLGWGGSLNRVKENDVFILYDGAVATKLPDMEVEIAKMTEPFFEKMELADNLIDVTTGKMPVVFSPRGTLVILLPLHAAINGRSVYTGSTPLIGKEGEKLFDENFTVVDDGTMPGGIGTAPFDDEGVLKRRLPIVENGVFKNFLFDKVTAAKSGRESNGCADRGIFSPPIPSTSNLAIAEGNDTKGDIIASIDNGILVDGVLGMGQGNIISGTFSNPFGAVFKIEKGKLVGRVKDGTISGNIYNDLKSIKSIGDEQETVYGSFHAPYIRVDSLNVTGK